MPAQSCARTVTFIYALLPAAAHGNFASGRSPDSRGVLIRPAFPCKMHSGVVDRNNSLTVAGAVSALRYERSRRAPNFPIIPLRRIRFGHLKQYTV